MYKNIISFAFVIILFASCAPTIQVTNLLDTQKINSKSKLYVLPKTIVAVDVTVTRKITYPGPYAEFSGKFIGEDNCVKKKTIDWKVNDIQISSFEIEDKNHFYVVTETDKSDLSFASLMDKSLIFPINGFPNSNDDLHNIPNTEEPNENEIFIDFSMKDNLVEREKTIYETESNDSTSYTVLKKKKLYSSRTIEEKAEEAADLLIRLRKRKFKLLAAIEKNTIGDKVRDYAKQYPEGEALKIMVNELEILENEIIAWFKGKTIEESFTYHFEYTPVKATGKYNLFSFSPTKGVLAPEEQADEMFTIRYNLEHNTSELTKLVSKKEETVFNMPVVRLPDNATFIIESNDIFKASKRLKIFQFGSLVTVNIAE